MQVSWIDPKEVAALAEGLRTAADSAPTPPLEQVGQGLQPFQSLTLEPDAQDEVEVPQEAHSVERPEQQIAADEVPEDDDLPMAAPESGPAFHPDLTAFRQRLLAIRQSAIGAGILAPKAVPEEPEALPIQPSPPPLPAAVPVTETMIRFQASAFPPDLPAAAPPVLPPTSFGSVVERLQTFAAWALGHLPGANLFVVDDHGGLLWGSQAQAGLILSSLMAWNAANRSSARSAYGGPEVIGQALPSGEVLTVIPCRTRLGSFQVAVASSQALAPTDVMITRDAFVSAMDGQGG